MPVIQCGVVVVLFLEVGFEEGDMFDVLPGVAGSLVLCIGDEGALELWVEEVVKVVGDDHGGEAPALSLGRSGHAAEEGWSVEGIFRIREE